MAESKAFVDLMWQISYVESDAATLSKVSETPRWVLLSRLAEYLEKFQTLLMGADNELSLTPGNEAVTVRAALSQLRMLCTEVEKSVRDMTTTLYDQQKDWAPYSRSYPMDFVAWRAASEPRYFQSFVVWDYRDEFVKLRNALRKVWDACQRSFDRPSEVQVKQAVDLRAGIARDKARMAALKAARESSAVAVPVAAPTATPPTAPKPAPKATLQVTPKASPTATPPTAPKPAPRATPTPAPTPAPKPTPAPAPKPGIGTGQKAGRPIGPKTVVEAASKITPNTASKVTGTVAANTTPTPAPNGRTKKAPKKGPKTRPQNKAI